MFRSATRDTLLLVGNYLFRADVKNELGLRVPGPPMACLSQLRKRIGGNRVPWVVVLAA
jgi:hypothetical protein